MPSAIYNPVLDKGADYSFALVFSDTNGARIDLTKVTIVTNITSHEGSDVSLGSFGMALDPSVTGRAVFTLSAAVSDSIPNSKPHYEIWVHNNTTGLNYRYVKGTLNLDA
jgi:hypothetical protein